MGKVSKLSRSRIAVCFALGYAFCMSLILYAGGKPNPGTPKDKRLKENKPAPQQPPKLPKKGGK
jgi:hypothetical protein